MGKYSDFMHVAPDEESRCQAANNCRLMRMPFSQYCPVHGGRSAFEKGKKELADLFRLKRYQARLEEMRDHAESSSFRNEIGILRILLEEKMKIVEDQEELLPIHTPGISDLIMKIGKLVQEAQKLELTLGKYLAEDQAAAMISEIIEIMAAHIEDSDVLEEVSQKLLESVEKAFKVAKDL